MLRAVVPLLCVLAPVALLPSSGLVCRHSRCSDGFCITQQAVNTTDVDCSTLVETWFDADLCGEFGCNSSAGHTANLCPFDACQTSVVVLSAGAPTVTTQSCASTCAADVNRFKCNRFADPSGPAGPHGDAPWTAGGMAVERLSVVNPGRNYYQCCAGADLCNAASSLLPNHTSSSQQQQQQQAGRMGEGWSYAQDPSWQAGQRQVHAQRRNCECENIFGDSCFPSQFFNPLIPSLNASELGRCQVMNDASGWATSTRRGRMEGLGPHPVRCHHAQPGSLVSSLPPALPSPPPLSVCTGCVCGGGAGVSKRAREPRC
jgi:hypothetical protein